MSLGFNSKVQLDGGLYHVQTEDRGLVHPYIDTLVLLQGQILHRCSHSYVDMLVSGTVDEEALRARVEQQHREVLDALRSGSLALEKVVPTGASAIAVTLCNAGSWLVAGKASLDIQVRTRRDNKPLAGALVEASFEGAAAGAETFSNETDADGAVALHFSVPKITDPEQAALVIRARAGEISDQIRYRLRPKSRESGTLPK